ncbi:unnamed protein product, partial [Rotaria sordida]
VWEVEHICNAVKELNKTIDALYKKGHFGIKQRDEMLAYNLLHETYYNCSKAVLKQVRQKEQTQPIHPNEKTKFLTCKITNCNTNYFDLNIFAFDIVAISGIKGYLKTREKVHLALNNLSIDDLCIVFNGHHEYFRGKIVSIIENKYDIICIDYGNILQNLTADQLFELPDVEVFHIAPLARQCQLYAVDDLNQSKAIEEIIKTIPSTEYVTISIENEDDKYLFVTLIRETNAIVNKKYRSDDKNIQDKNEKKSDNGKHLTLTTDVQPGESTCHDDHTIDYGEDDLSTSTKINVETNNSKKKTN